MMHGITENNTRVKTVALLVAFLRYTSNLIHLNEYNNQRREMQCNAQRRCDDIILKLFVFRELHGAVDKKKFGQRQMNFSISILN